MLDWTTELVLLSDKEVHAYGPIHNRILQKLIVKKDVILMVNQNDRIGLQRQKSANFGFPKLNVI